MDSSLKNLEKRLEQLTPRGMSDEGLSRCEALFDQLASEEVTEEIHRSPIGWSWKVTSIAAAVVLCIGLTSGWWLGQGREVSPAVSGVVDQPSFELVGERAWMQMDGSSEMMLSSAGEVLEVATELDVSEETVLHRESGNYITLRVLTRQSVERVTDQF
ncbi:hypothetical protein N9051_00775 [Akkermansiaceae bacterium]|nr:hypothetical protein [Akkermansiaceae bacterium]